MPHPLPTVGPTGKAAGWADGRFTPVGAHHRFKRWSLATKMDISGMIRFSRIRIFFLDGTEPYFGAAVEVASCNRGTATMKKAGEAHKPKENDRGTLKPWHDRRRPGGPRAGGGWKDARRPECQIRETGEEAGKPFLA